MKKKLSLFMLLNTRVYCVLEIWYFKYMVNWSNFLQKNNQDQKEEKLSLNMLLNTRVYYILDIWYFKDMVNWLNFLKKAGANGIIMLLVCIRAMPLQRVKTYILCIISSTNIQP